MGRDKAFLPWEGTTLLQHAIARLQPFGPARLLSGNAADHGRAEQLAAHGVLVPDRTPDSGPLGGVDAALRDVSTDWALILPIDQPLLPAVALLDWSRSVVASDALASWLTQPDGPEPLPLLLHRSLFAPLAQLLTQGQRRLLLAVRAAAGDKLLAVAADNSHWFRNLNHPQDLEEITRSERVD